MTDLSNFCVYTVQRGNEWIVATKQSPYFCFHAETEQKALAKASAALSFYRKAHDYLGQQQGEQEAFPWAWRGVSAQELVAA